jgi:hypothetical protein
VSAPPDGAPAHTIPRDADTSHRPGTGNESRGPADVLDMSSGCRDCRICTAPGLSKLARGLARGTVAVGTFGGSVVASRAVRSHCPVCSHRLGKHERRRDGSFKD